MRKKQQKSDIKVQDQIVTFSTAEKASISFQLSNLLKRLSQILPDIQSTILINLKNLTPLMFWFIIDCFYFPQEISQQYLTITLYRFLSTQQSKSKKHNQEHHKSHKGMIESENLNEKEEEFLQILSNWISDFKNTDNPEDIRETSLSEAIEIAEGNLEVFADQIDQSFQNLLGQANSLTKKDEYFMVEHFGQLKNVPPMFKFDEVQQVICEKQMRKYQLSAIIPTCYICLQPHDLIQCKTCSLKVHQKCYPTLTKKKGKKVKVQKLTFFQCQNCKHSIDGENTLCELCCCLGGYFVKYSHDSDEEIINLDTSNIQELKTNSHLIFKINKSNRKIEKYIHLSCFVWNPQIQWNEETKQVVSIHRIEKKKINAICSSCGISFGASVPCTNQTCRRFYHPQCARKNNLQMNYITAKTAVIQLFCSRHQHLRSYEAIEQAHIRKFREVRKLFEAIQKEIKRQNLGPTNPYLKKVGDNSVCSGCKKSEVEGPVEFCVKCKKWYHKSCAKYCQNCF